MAKEKGPVTDENVKSPKYSDETAKAQGDAIAKQQANSSNAVPVPDGVGFDVPDERADRAEDAMGRPVSQVKIDPENGPPSVVQVFADKKRLEDEADLKSDIGFDDDSVGLPAEPPLGEPEPSAQPGPPRNRPFYPEETNPPVNRAAIYMLVTVYANRWRCIEFANFERLRGFVQEQPGERHIFQRVEGRPEYQEIKGNGQPIHY